MSVFNGIEVPMVPREDGSDIRPFQLIREQDPTGVSGTGIVAQGCYFPVVNKAVVCWVGKHRSVVVWDDLNSMMKVHGHGGLTQIRWIER